MPANSRLLASMPRNSTKACTTYTLNSVARGLLRTIVAMMAPCSVNANGPSLAVMSGYFPSPIGVGACDTIR